jgi:hypothetical protein
MAVHQRGKGGMAAICGKLREQFCIVPLIHRLHIHL